MKAEWDDAPLRVRKAPSHLPMIFSLIVVTSLAAGGVYWAERTGQIDVGLSRKINDLLNNDRPVPGQMSEQANKSELANDKPKRSRAELLEILERDGSLTVSEEEYELALSLLQDIQVYQHSPPAPEDWAQMLEEKPERQTVFTDSNYVPRMDVNGIDMNSPSTRDFASTEQPAGKREYVSVIEQSRTNGCLAANKGSIECRRVRSALREHYNRQCKFGSHSSFDACKIARAYDPSK